MSSPSFSGSRDLVHLIFKSRSSREGEGENGGKGKGIRSTNGRYNIDRGRLRRV